MLECHTCKSLSFELCNLTLKPVFRHRELRPVEARNLARRRLQARTTLPGRIDKSDSFPYDKRDVARVVEDLEYLPESVRCRRALILSGCASGAKRKRRKEGCIEHETKC